LFSFVALSGLSPVKVEQSLRIRTDKDLDLVQVLYDSGEQMGEEYTHFPFPIGEDLYFKFSIPKIVARESIIQTIEIEANGTIIGKLDLAENLAVIAEEVFRAKKSLIFLKAFFRSINKAITSNKLKKKADTGGLEGWLKKAAIDIAADLTENADIRCSHLLPGKIYIGDFLLKPGEYNFIIRFIDYHGQISAEKYIEKYQVKQNNLNILEAVSFY